AFHHSMNYRSVVVHGRAVEVTNGAEKEAAMLALVDHVVPGRGAGTRPPTEAELRATIVLAMPLDEASAKVRTGPPVDDADDLGLAVWAGVLPLSVVPGVPEPDPGLLAGVELPDHVARWRRP
nr:pyridoxamine 5'-phosphate oxidase family protein [Acidimicrobiia bacterium]